MKSSIACLTLLVLSAPLEDATLAFDPEEGTTLTRTFVAEAEYELDSMTFAVDGEVVQEVEDLEVSTESLERIVVTDEILEVEDGRPTDIERTFDELHQSGSETAGEEESESVSTSDLEGRVLRFLWDDDEEDWFAEIGDDGDDLDADTLEWLHGDMDLLAFLPQEAELEVGDEWELDAKAYLALMWPGGLFGFMDEDEDEADPLSVSLNRQMIENLSGEGLAVLDELDDDGLALITVELDVQSYADADGEVDDVDMEYEFEIERTITGQLYFNLEEKRFEGGTFEADAERVRRMSWVAETEQGDFDVTRTETYSGSIDYEVEFELL